MSSNKNTDKTKDLTERTKPPGLLGGPLPMIKDAEGDHVPDNLPPIVDAHVHLFPDNLFASIWQWFDQYGWPIRYKLNHC